MTGGPLLKFLPSIDRYIFRLVTVPMAAVFAIAASLLVLDKMLRLFDFVPVEGGPVGVVFKMLVALVPEYASLAIPLGLLLGILLAFRKLATTSELDVFRAVGLGYGRLLRVPFAITAVLMAVNVALVFFIQPISRYYYEQMEYELRSGALGASIKVGEFTTLADRMALRIEESEDDGRRLKGIFARVANDQDQVLSISAKEGAFLATTDSPDTIILRLTNGTIVQDTGSQTPRVLTFTRHDLPIDLPAIEQFRDRGDAEREYILPELLRVGWSDEQPDDKRDASQASFNFRLVEVVMMALLPLLAVALGVPPMLIGIPGDNTYSNYKEATLAFWRMTVLPLVQKMAAALSAWLDVPFGAEVEVRADIDRVPALSAERDALWARLEGASFATGEEKRKLAGLQP